ncbi:MAG TPA: fumarylacetoacetate hydrolase family protein [Polyangia bacterium]|nr:fumarylacetoacetate hydrolase family protein [Polyangia bacterium]
MKLVQFRLRREEKAVPRTGALIAGGKAILDLASTLDGHGKGGWLPAHTSCEWYNVDGSVWSLVRSACEVALSADDKTVAQWMKQGRVVALEDARLTAPVPRPGKLICIGLNYRDHALEQGVPVPESPIVFSKFTTAIVGPEDQVVVPPACKEPDYEAELAVVIGRTAKNVSRETAYQHVFGYCAFNDISGRDFQFADKQWQRGKSCDTFAPMGPFVATREEIKDPHGLGIKLRLNGEVMQNSRTDQLIFKVPELIEFLSASVTLEPGDIIATGTPPGVGFARKPPVYLKSGDRMEVEIDGLGVLVNSVR